MAFYQTKVFQYDGCMNFPYGIYVICVRSPTPFCYLAEDLMSPVQIEVASVYLYGSIQLLSTRRQSVTQWHEDRGDAQIIKTGELCPRGFAGGSYVRLPKSPLTKQAVNIKLMRSSSLFAQKHSDRL